MISEKLQNVLLGFQESLTGNLATISTDHEYIHEGKAFTAIIDTGSISAAYKIGFTTEATVNNAHWRPIGITTSADYVSMELHEADSFTSGTAVTPINRNRNSTETTGMQAMAKGVTSTPTGTIIQHAGIGVSGNPVSRSGGGASATDELVLKPNTSYVMVLTPAAATTVKLTLFWYEEASA